MGIISDFLDRIFGLGEPGPGPAKPPVVPGPPNPGPGLDEQLRRAHNRERVARGLAPLTGDERLRHAARAHADFMARKGIMAHMGIGDGDPWGRIAAEGYRFAAAAENCAAGARDVAQVMADWMASPGHRADILGPYTAMGAGCALGRDGTLYWVVDFARPEPRTAAR